MDWSSMNGKSILQHLGSRFISLQHSAMSWLYFLYHASNSFLQLRDLSQKWDISPEEWSKWTYEKNMGQHIEKQWGRELPGSQSSDFFFFFPHLQLTNTPVHVACYTHNSNSVIKQRVSSSHSFHIIDNCFKVTAKLSMYLGTAKHLSPPGPLQLLFCPLQWAAGK